jgi:hypothetical protein
LPIEGRLQFWIVWYIEQSDGQGYG